MGVVNRVTHAVENLLFDCWNGTNTRGVATIDPADVVGSSFPDAVSYVSTGARTFRAVVSSAALPPNSVFMDVGAGKGKVLMLATQFDFRKIVGVEFSRSLCAAAVRNIEIFSRGRRPAVTPVVVHSDIVDYELHDENVFFLYNPFHSAVMEKFLRNLDLSLLHNPRKAWIIYHQPFTPCRSLIEAAGFSEEKVLRYGQAVFRVYHRAAEPDGVTMVPHARMHV